MGLNLANLIQLGSSWPRADRAVWRFLTGLCELDTLVTAMKMIAWRIAQGALGLRLDPAVIATIGVVRRQRPDRSHAIELKAYSTESKQLIGEV